jgi:hypothetical protein
MTRMKDGSEKFRSVFILSMRASAVNLCWHDRTTPSPEAGATPPKTGGEPVGFWILDSVRVLIVIGGYTLKT